MVITLRSRNVKLEHMYRTLKIFGLVIALFGYFFVASAQIPGHAIELDLSVENPTPGQEIVITARSYSLDINASTVTWTINGQQVQKGIGLTQYTFKAPALGKKTTIGVSAVSSGGKSAYGSVSINSGSVDLIVETDGYVPPFFKGKLPIVYQNSIKIIAIPHLARADGTLYDPKTLVYKWQKGSETFETESGYGKQSISFVGEIVPREFTINVTVYNREGTISTSGYMPITFTSPSISFYVNDPLYGPLYNKAIRENLSIGKEGEVRVISAPFGFSKNNFNLQYDWEINGENDPNLAQSESVIFRAPTNSDGGVSAIDLTVTNIKSMLQNARMSMRAMYDSRKDPNSTNSQVQF